MNNQKKIGFWSLFALVTGSQIGSGVFVLPTGLAPYGSLSLIGWILSSIGAILLALVFAELSRLYPKTGGPHAYVQVAFGPTAAFFTGWTYWVISWVSFTSVVISAIGYLMPLIGSVGPYHRLLLEIFLLVIITAINLLGVRFAGHTELFLTVLKFIPLIFVPFVALFYMDLNNFTFIGNGEFNSLPTITLTLGHVTLMTLWGFIGLETATTPAGSVENPRKNIPKAVIWGTICVAFIYFFNSLSMIGFMSSEKLAQTEAPYVEIARGIWGGSWHLLVSLITSILCIGTLNAWVLTSGQIALGVAEDGLLPSFFAKKNRYDAPVWGLILAFLGVIPFLIFTMDTSWSKQVNSIIDFSVTSFLFVYTICCLALIKILLKRDEKGKKAEQGHKKLVWVSLFALLFCLAVIFTTSMPILLFSLIFPLSGLPIYLFWRKK